MTVLTIRACRRYAVRHRIELCRPGGPEAPGLMIELSTEGCRISNLGSAEFSIGDPVSAEFAGQKLEGCIRWARPGMAGVRFDKPLFSSQLAAMLARSRDEEPQAPANAVKLRLVSDRRRGSASIAPASTAPERRVRARHARGS